MRHLRLLSIVMLTLFLVLPAGHARGAGTDALAARLDALEAENAALRERVARLEAAVGTASSPSVAAQAAPEPAAPAEPATTVSSYGEIGYTRPSRAPSQASVDVARAVIGITHRFDDTTKMVGEWEWEHAVVSSGDSGESEVEQLYVEHQFNPRFRAVAGLYLMPAGLINEHHEPTAYYGVFRPDVDTRIIPSTWREAGVGGAYTTDAGLTWEGGITTAPDLAKWDPASNEGFVRGPLAAIHGEGQFAVARDPGLHASLNWRVPGAAVGASVFWSKAGQDQPSFAASDAHLLLWEVHGRYQAGRWDFAGEYARGTLSGTGALDRQYLASGIDDPTLVPSLFYGGYLQAAWRAWSDGYFRLQPFVRFEILNAAAAFGAGAPARSRDEYVSTLGASLFIGDGVVLKADYRDNRNDPLPSAVPPGYLKGNSLNVGVGYSF